MQTCYNYSYSYCCTKALGLLVWFVCLVYVWFVCMCVVFRVWFFVCVCFGVFCVLLFCFLMEANSLLKAGFSSGALSFTFSQTLDPRHLSQQHLCSEQGRMSMVSSEGDTKMLLAWARTEWSSVSAAVQPDCCSPTPRGPRTMHG